MADRIEITVTSYPDRDHRHAELWIDGHHCGDIIREEPAPQLVTYAPITVDLELLRLALDRGLAALTAGD